MDQPSATPLRARRRPTVGVGVLLAVVIAAFLWGLAMYAIGAAGRDAGPPGDAGEAALSQLTRIDQALGASDAVSARAQLAQLALPAGPAWTAARALRERAAAALALRSAERLAVQARAQRLAARLLALPGAGQLLDLAAAPGAAPGAAPAPGGDLLALAWTGAHGAELRVSSDGGGRWSPLAETLHGLPWRLVHHALSPLLLAIAPDEGGGVLAWSSRDGRAFSALRLPERSAGDLDGRWAVGGDGALVAAAQGPGGAWCMRSSDAGANWQAGAVQAALLLIAPTAGGTLVLARGPQGLVRISGDGGASFHDGEQELAALFPPGAPPRLHAIGGGCLVVATQAVRRLDASGRLLAQAVMLPGSTDAEAIIAHPQHAQRWYALHDQALWRSDDGGGHWLRGWGRLGELHGRCLEFAPGARPRLLIGGDALWALDDEDEPLLFGDQPAP